jgi:hypothetical protein
MLSRLRCTLAWVVLASAAAAACGPFHRGNQPDAVVVFHNNSTDQADVYALGSGGAPIRVGTVFPNRTESLRIPPDVMGGANRVNIIVRVFASSKVVASGPFSLGPGESMDVTMPPEENLLAVLPTREP